MKAGDGFHVTVKLGMALLLTAFICRFADAQEKYWVPKEPPKSRYTIKVTIEPEKKLVQGAETIVFKNDSPRPIFTLAFDWYNNSIRSMNVSYENKYLKHLYQSFQSEVLSPVFFTLPEPILPGRSVRLTVEFVAKDLIGNDLKEIWLKDFYPRLWWDGLPLHDSYEVKVNAPDEYNLVASGKLDEKSGYYKNNGTKSFGICLGKDFYSMKTELDGISFKVIYTDEGTKCAEFCIKTAVDVVDFYKRFHGFYPFDFLNIVPGGPGVWGGFPFASGIVSIHGMGKFDTVSLPHWKWITAHEIGHQYWGEYVIDGNDPPWLWIGLGIYADRQ